MQNITFTLFPLLLNATSHSHAPPPHNAQKL